VKQEFDIAKIWFCYLKSETGIWS